MNVSILHFFRRNFGINSALILRYVSLVLAFFIHWYIYWLFFKSIHYIINIIRFLACWSNFYDFRKANNQLILSSSLTSSNPNPKNLDYNLIILLNLCIFLNTACIYFCIILSNMYTFKWKRSLKTTHFIIFLFLILL